MKERREVEGGKDYAEIRKKEREREKGIVNKGMKGQSKKM
jgi:hypothetical protein